MKLSLEATLDPAVVHELHDRINTHNMDITGDRAYRPLYAILRDEQGVVKGGLLADLWGGWMHVNFLWVAEELRGQGYGTRLVAEAEREARAAGCRGSYLETFSFQARPFYEKQGYTVIASLPDYPAGHTYYFLRKFLGEAT
jgi:GNAT superfamily N-acetyltransferase